MIIAAENAGNGKLYLFVLRCRDIECGLSAFAFKSEHACRMRDRFAHEAENYRTALRASVCYISLLGLKYHIVSPIKLSLVKSQSYKLLGKWQGIFHTMACCDIAIGDKVCVDYGCALKLSLKTWEAGGVFTVQETTSA